MTAPSSDPRPAVVTPYPDGPLLLRGSFEIRTPDGELIPPGRPVVALCRCGWSTIKPFCDGSHVRGFRAGTQDERPTASRPAES
jgi:CDGSH-type Zn-finger protein